MRAVVWHGVGDIRLDDVPEPQLRDPGDAIVRVTTAAICGTDLHVVRGTMTGMREGTILGHEMVGVVEEVGPGVRNLTPGTRVVVGSTLSCGYCSYCRSGTYSQCDNANPGGHLAGTAFFGGPESAGSFDGFQAEYARVPFANVIAVPLPEQVTDEQAIMISDIWPTGWFAGRLAEIGRGDTVAVFGLGPVGQFAVLSAFLQGAGRVLAVDRHRARLDAARSLGAEVVDFDAEDPVAALRDLTGGIGPDRVVDAVGVDAESPRPSPGTPGTPGADGEEVDLWSPGNAPSQAARWAVESVAKAGTVGVVGVYPPQLDTYPFGLAFSKNLTLRTGNCPHRRYIPDLVRLVAAGVVDPATVLTQVETLPEAIEAYGSFDRREEGWIKTALVTDAISAGRRPG